MYEKNTRLRNPFLILSMLLLSNVFVCATAQLHYTFQGKNESLNLFNDLLPQHINEYHHMQLVDMMLDYKIFDYCLLESYTLEGISALLATHHINATNNQRWIAYYSEYNPRSLCVDRLSLSLKDSCAL